MALKHEHPCNKSITLCPSGTGWAGHLILRLAYVKLTHSLYCVPVCAARPFWAPTNTTLLTNTGSASTPLTTSLMIPNEHISIIFSFSQSLCAREYTMGLALRGLGSTTSNEKGYCATHPTVDFTTNMLSNSSNYLNKPGHSLSGAMPNVTWWYFSYLYLAATSYKCLSRSPYFSSHNYQSPSGSLVATAMNCLSGPSKVSLFPANFGPKVASGLHTSGLHVINSSLHVLHTCTVRAIPPCSTHHAPHFVHRAGSTTCPLRSAFQIPETVA